MGGLGEVFSPDQISIHLIPERVTLWDHRPTSHTCFFPQRHIVRNVEIITLFDIFLYAEGIKTGLQLQKKMLCSVQVTLKHWLFLVCWYSASICVDKWIHVENLSRQHISRRTVVNFNRTCTHGKHKVLGLFISQN